MVCVSGILQTQYNLIFSIFLIALRLLLVPFAVGNSRISFYSRHFSRCSLNLLGIYCSLDGSRPNAKAVAFAMA